MSFRGEEMCEEALHKTFSPVSPLSPGGSEAICADDQMCGMSARAHAVVGSLPCPSVPTPATVCSITATFAGDIHSSRREGGNSTNRWWRREATALATFRSAGAEPRADPATSTGVDNKEGKERALPQGLQCSGNLCICSRFLKKKWVFLLLLLFTVILLNSVSSITRIAECITVLICTLILTFVCLVPWFLTPDLSLWDCHFISCHQVDVQDFFVLFVVVVVVLIRFWTGACTYFQKLRESLPSGEDLPKAVAWVGMDVAKTSQHPSSH